MATDKTRTNPTPRDPWDKPFAEWTVADGLAAWHNDGACQRDAHGCACPCHAPMPEQARAEGRQQAVREIRAELPGYTGDLNAEETTGYDFALRHFRAILDRVTGLNVSESERPRTEAGKAFVAIATSQGTGLGHLPEPLPVIVARIEAEGRQQAVREIRDWMPHKPDSPFGRFLDRVAGS